MPVILNGTELAKPMRHEIETEVQAFVKTHGFAPTAAIVRAGDDPASISNDHRYLSFTPRVVYHPSPISLRTFL